MTFTRKILIGLFLGIALGLFFGEIVAPLEAGGRIFIGMLQMTVLPYIILSLVINLGRISWAESPSPRLHSRLLNQHPSSSHLWCPRLRLWTW
jgi:Na+/H+-dicarboxylate symporter